VVGSLVLGLLVIGGPALAHTRADIEVKKLAGSATINAGELAEFTIEVVNNGPDAALEVILDDRLPNSGLDWFEAPDRAACTITDDPAGDLLHCDIGTLAAGAFFSVTVKAQTDEGDCGVLANEARASAKNEPPEFLGNNSDSASITVVCPPPRKDEGCTPGFWKTHPERWDGVGDDLTSTVQTTDLFNATFGVTSAQSGIADSVTLLEATRLRGGGVLALNRHASAALANADSGIAFEFSVAEVIALYRDAVGVDPGPATVESAHATLEEANERGCPLS
jgi:uncharacterized repeat protein (TIGR01451 family)